MRKDDRGWRIEEEKQNCRIGGRSRRCVPFSQLGAAFVLPVSHLLAVGGGRFEGSFGVGAPGWPSPLLSVQHHAQVSPIHFPVCSKRAK